MVIINTFDTYHQFDVFFCYDVQEVLAAADGPHVNNKG